MSTRYSKLAGKTFLMVVFIGPLLVGLALALLISMNVLLIPKYGFGFELFRFIKSLGAMLAFSYIFGFVPALVAGFVTAGLVYLRGRLFWLWLPIIGFASGFVGWYLVAFPKNGFADLYKTFGMGSFLGLCGLLASLLLLPLLWRMKIVGKRLA